MRIASQWFSSFTFSGLQEVSCPLAAAGRHQLQASGDARGQRAGGLTARRLHDQQHDGHQAGVAPAQLQVRQDVRKAGVRPLVPGREHGRGRVPGGSRQPGRPRDGLRGGEHSHIHD